MTSVRAASQISKTATADIKRPTRTRWCCNDTRLRPFTLGLSSSRSVFAVRGGTHGNRFTSLRRDSIQSLVRVYAYPRAIRSGDLDRLCQLKRLPPTNRCPCAEPASHVANGPPCPALLRSTQDPCHEPTSRRFDGDDPR